MKNREAALAALKSIRAEIAKAEAMRLKSLREKKQAPTTEKAEPAKTEQP